MAVLTTIRVIRDLEILIIFIYLRLKFTEPFLCWRLGNNGTQTCGRGEEKREGNVDELHGIFDFVLETAALFL
jgi:hypothetical protein